MNSYIDLLTFIWNKLRQFIDKTSYYKNSLSLNEFLYWFINIYLKKNYVRLSIIQFTTKFIIF